MKKLSFDEVFEALSNERLVDVNSVSAKALRRRVWLMLYCAPGCLPDHREVCLTKDAAMQTAQLLYADYAPRGFITKLRRNNIAATDENGYYRVQLSRVQVRELF